MSAAGLAGRLSVCALFCAAAVATAPLLRPGVPPGAPSGKQLEALESGMLAAARLHPAAPAPAPAGSAVFCAGCHEAPAHPGRGVRPALANAHGVRMDCLLCHWSAANGPRPAPSWRVAADGDAFLAVLAPERAAPADLERLRAAVTASRRCFERGPACEGCHKPGGMAGLARPGTSAVRAAGLERLENYFTLAAGEKWYFPQLQ